MRKTLALAVAMIMLLAAIPFAGSSAADLDPYVIDFWMLVGSVSSEKAMIEAEINKIIEPKFNATINITMVDWDNWWTQVSLLNAGEKVDLLFTADWWQYTEGIANNYFLPLNDLIAEYAPEVPGKLGDAFINGTQVNGINYGIPTNKELAVNGGFMWNKTLADKYDLVPDPSWRSHKDWEPFLEIIAENEPDVIPILTPGGWAHMDWVDYIPCHIGWQDIGNDDPELRFRWETEYYIEELRAVREMYEKGYFPADAAIANSEYFNKHVQLGDFFLTTQPLKPGKGKSTELMSQLLTPGIEYDEFETFPLVGTTNHTGGSMYAIASTSDDPARAMMFLNEMHTNPDIVNLLVWGIEGLTYEVVEEEPVKIVRSVPGNTWTPNVYGWMIGDYYSIYLAEGEPLDKYDLLRATKECTSHIANGYRFDTEPWLDTITAVLDVLDEYEKPLLAGALDVDEGLAALIAAVEAAGFREYFAAVQADYEAWLAAK